MADRIVYNYTEMQSAVDRIEAIADQYKAAGEAFITDFVSATNEWEGDSKDQMLRLINGDVNTLLTESIHSYLYGLADLLAQNIAEMRRVDGEIATSIPDHLN